MVNKAPNQSGLKQNRKTAKKAKRIQKKLDDQINAVKKAAEKIEKVRGDPDLFIDTYMIHLADKYPDDIKAAKQLLKWKELKDREGQDSFLDQDY